MPNQSTLTLGSMAPDARSRPDHPTPVPLPPLPVYCKQGDIATLTSCTPPWMSLGITYLRPRLAPPHATVVRPAIPWLAILATAAIAAVVTVAAAHLLNHAATVQTVDSALATHAIELAQPVSGNQRPARRPDPAATRLEATRPW